MKIIKEIGIAGVAGFKKSVLPIKPGVTYLYGCNELDNRNSNAVGKSAIASSPADIFYDTPMVGERQDRTKTGARYIKYRENGKNVFIATKFEGKTEKIAYKIDGEDKSLRTMAMTRKKIREAWGISEEDYRTYGYLDAATPHPLVRGSSTERKAFFIKFFQLDRLDEEKKVIKKQLDELKKVRAQHLELQRTFDEIKKDMLTREQREQLEARVAKLERKIKGLQSKVEEAQRVKRLHDFRDYAGSQIKKLKKLASLDDFEAAYKKFQTELKKAKESDEQWVEYRDYLKALDRYRKETEDLDMSEPLEKLEVASQKHKAAKLDLEKKELELSELEIDEPKKVSKPGAQRDDLLADRAKLRHQLEHAQKFKSGVCGECGQPVKAKNPQELRAKLEEVTSELAAWDSYERYKVKKTEYEASVERKSELERSIKSTKELIANTKAAADLYQKRKHIRKPEKVEKPDSEFDLEALKEQRETWTFGAENIESIRELETLPEDAVALDLTELSEWQEKISALKSKLEVHNTVKARATRMRNRLKQLEAQLEDEEALELILKGYADKEMKRMAIEEISKQLMQSINVYAPIAFDNYVFSFKWDTQIRLLVKRPGTEATDVRKLSGAERMLFTYMLVWACLMYVNQKKRLSMLTLDEPSASFSKETNAKFHKLLEHMLQVIPSILILTPKSDERYPGAHEYTVYRDKTGAEIRKGHPDHV